MFTLQENTKGSRLGEALSSGIQRGADFGQQIQMQQMKQKKEDGQLKSQGLDAIQRMREIVSRGKTGWNFANYFTEEGRGDRAAMDSAALNLERLAVEMQGKGTLNKSRFDYMVKRLPSSSKSDAENKKILNEWENILNEGKMQTALNSDGSGKKSNKSSGSKRVRNKKTGKVYLIPEDKVESALSAGGELE